MRVSCGVSAASGASDACDFGAVASAASCVWCDECADGDTDINTDGSTDGSADGSTDGCTHCVTYGCSYLSSDVHTDERSLSSEFTQMLGKSSRWFKRLVHAYCPRWHALLRRCQLYSGLLL